MMKIVMEVYSFITKIICSFHPSHHLFVFHESGRKQLLLNIEAFICKIFHDFNLFEFKSEGSNNCGETDI